MLVAQALGGGPFETVAGAAVAAGSLLLVLAVVALGAFTYRSLAGDGVEWPDETDDDGTRRGDADDEWEYY